jgi:acetolactate decarboxylase
MKSFISNCLIISLFFLIGCTNRPNPVAITSNVVFQYSTLSALLEGVYDGEMTVGELKRQGNYGIGTFNALDGEMVLYKGECYKVTSDSKVFKVDDTEKTPFAAVCSFVPDTVIKIDQVLKLINLEHYIDSVVPSKNLLYAYEISGSFDSILIRSVPKQDKPYKRLIEAFKNQRVYSFTQQEGMLFGYKFPLFLKDVNMDNYHLHYLSNDKTKGGHLLNCMLSKGTVSIAYIRKFNLQIPDNLYFNTTNLINNKSELLKIENSNK